MTYHNITRNAHQPAMRRHNYGEVQPMEQPRHRISDAVWHGGMRTYYIALAVGSIAFGFYWS